MNKQFYLVARHARGTRPNIVHYGALIRPVNLYRPPDQTSRCHTRQQISE